VSRRQFTEVFLPRFSQPATISDRSDLHINILQGAGLRAGQTGDVLI